MTRLIHRGSGGRFARGRDMRKVFRVAVRILTDFFLVGFAAGLNLGFPPLIFVGLIIGVLRLFPRFRKSKIVFCVYWIGIILTFDLMFILVFAGLYSMGKFWIPALFAFYFAVLYARRKLRWFEWLTPTQLSVAPIFLALFLLKSGEIANPRKACFEIDGKPGLRCLTDPKYNHTKIPHTAIPRFFVDRPELGDMLVCNHVYVFEKNYLLKNGINRLDLRTRKLHPWVERGEVLQIARDDKTKEIFAVMQKNYKDAKAPNVEFVRFGDDGRARDRDSFNLNRNTYYIAGMLLTPERAYVFVEGEAYVYDRRTGALKSEPVDGLGHAPIYRSQGDWPWMFGSFTSSPLMSWLLGGKHVLKFDLRERRLVATRWGNPFGYYDITLNRKRRLIAVSHAFSAGGVLFDFNLRKIRELNIPAGVREIEFSPDGERLYAAGFFDGILSVIDVDANRPLGGVYVGRGSRGMTVLADGRVIVGASCGVVEFRPNVFLKSSRRSAH